MIRTIIVDDEIEAREGLELLLKKEEGFVLAGSCKDGEQAIHMINTDSPDLVLLDIQMPEKNGFEVLEEIVLDKMPLIVFVTAFDEYALNAFEVHAIDYLQKPFTDERFKACLDHVKAQHSLNQDKSGLTDLIREIQDQPSDSGNDRQLVIKSSGRIHFLDFKNIECIEGFDYYIKVHSNEEVHLVRKSLSRILDELPSQFIRIHNSTIINRHHLKELEPLSRGSYQVHLKSGRLLVLSKKYKDMHPTLFP